MTSASQVADYGVRRNSDEDRFFEELFGTTRVMIILRGLGTEASVARAVDAWDHGVRAVEVTIAQESDVDSLRAVVNAARGRDVRVGAGSIYRVAQVETVVQAEADFTVAPGLDADVSRACLAAGLPHMPGVGSASEITHAETLGHTWLKVFPAAELGSSWIKAMGGPFPWPKWIATGGMTPATAPDFLAAGARAVGMGTRIDDWSKAGELLGH